MSSPENLLPETQVAPPAEPVLAPVETAINPGAENPPCSGLDLLLIGLVLLVALFFFSALFLVLSLHSSTFRGAGTSTPSLSSRELANAPGPLVIVPAMTLAYMTMLAAMVVVVKRRHQRPFWQTVGWHWPSRLWLGYVLGGGLLAMGLGLLSRLLPIPKSLPMDRFFQDGRGAYLMMVFGVAVAPLAEEMLFRGFLYPVLDRWLETLLLTPYQIRRGCLWLLVMAAWGFISHRLSLPGSLLLVGAIFVATAVLFISRSMKPGGQAHFVILPGAALVAWGMMSRALSHQVFDAATIALVVAAIGFGLLGMASPMGTSVAGRGGRFLAVLITSGGFAMVHGEQLGQAWGPLLVLFVVGLVLTLARVVTRSITPGLLIHVGYNLALFTLLYVGTDHFRHLERMTQ